MNDVLQFRPVTLADQSLLREHTMLFCGKNCDLNFMNIFSWSFLYQTEISQWKNHLIFRFKADGHNAYMRIFESDDLQEILEILIDESERSNHPFLLMGVDEGLIPDIEKAKPGYFVYEYDRDYCDYIYRKADEEERTSMQRVFNSWDELDGTGGAIFIGKELIAFTYGAPINDCVFDVCVEKANPEYEGSYATINKEFVTHLPQHYTFINREEDLGLEGLRKSKLSYHPEILLKKYAVMAKHHFKDGHVR